MAKRNTEPDFDLEKKMLEQEAEGTSVEAALADAEEQGFMPSPKPGMPLPDGFENPPKGDPGHFCIRHDGCYDPTWFQVKIEGRHEGEANPVKFPNPGGMRGAVHLDTWADVPPDYIRALEAAVEVHHKPDPRAKDGNWEGMTVDGQKPQTEKIERDRFIWRMLPSA